MVIFTAYLNKPISSFRTPHQVWREEIEHGTSSLGLWNYLHNPIPLSAQPSHTPGALVRGLISFISWLSLQAMYGLLVFYMIFQAVMILKGSYNVVSMK